MRIVVTGGAGFVGRRVVDLFVERGDDVTVLDPADPQRDDLRTVVGSVTDADLVQRHLTGADAVVHLAGLVRDGMRDRPYEGSVLQLEGTLNVLEGCRRHDVGWFGLASSYYVYDGIPAVRRVDEQTPLDPRVMELFGSAKLMSEVLCEEYAARHALACTSYRLGPLYGGPGGTSAIDTFVRKGLRGEVIDIWGRGERRNQYTYAGDVAKGIVAGLTGDPGTYNLVADTPVSLAELAAALDDEFGFRTTFDPDRPEGPSLPTISSERARRGLDWSPVDLRAGLRHTVAAEQAALEEATAGRPA